MLVYFNEVSNVFLIAEKREHGKIYYCHDWGNGDFTNWVCTGENSFPSLRKGISEAGAAIIIHDDNEE